MFARLKFFAKVLALVLLTALNFATAQDRWTTGDVRERSDSEMNFGRSWQGSNWLGGGIQQKKEWRLGIQGDPTTTGVLVRSITPGGAASRARIEAGDNIVAIDGFQVGLVSGRLYDLDEEINRRADASGAVALLIQDHVSGRLASIRIQLDDGQSALSGTLVYRGRDPLPRDAIVTVLLENITRPYYVVRGGQESFRPTTSTGSIPFEITYDPSYIDAQDTYRVRAFVTSGGRTILDTASPQNVLTRGNPSRVRMELTSIGNNSLVSTNSSVVTAGYPNFNEINNRIIAMYRQYVKRDPTSLELAALQQIPGIETRINTMHLELMAAQEYFDLTGNNNRVWLESVFFEIVKRRPTQSEIDQWMQRYADLRYSRTELLRQLYAATNR